MAGAGWAAEELRGAPLPEASGGLAPGASEAAPSADSGVAALRTAAALSAAGASVSVASPPPRSEENDDERRNPRARRARDGTAPGRKTELASKAAAAARTSAAGLSEAGELKAGGPAVMRVRTQSATSRQHGRRARRGSGDKHGMYGDCSEGCVSGLCDVPASRLRKSMAKTTAVQQQKTTRPKRAPVAIAFCSSTHAVLTNATRKLGGVATRLHRKRTRSTSLRARRPNIGPDSPRGCVPARLMLRLRCGRWCVLGPWSCFVSWTGRQAQQLF